MALLSFIAFILSCCSHLYSGAPPFNLQLSQQLCVTDPDEQTLEAEAGDEEDSQDELTQQEINDAFDDLDEGLSLGEEGPIDEPGYDNIIDDEEIADNAPVDLGPFDRECD
jgi:hypothetical protein